MEKSLYNGPALIFSGELAQKIFDKPKKTVPAEVRREKIKESKKILKQSGFFDN